MPEEIERQIKQLPQGAVTSAFQVLADSLRENRRMIKQRMDEQDHKLELIYQETKRTNGRVSDLERGRELEGAIRTERSRWDAEREHERERGEVQERVAWTQREKWFASILGVITTAALVLQALQHPF